MIRFLCGLWAFVRTATYPDHIPLTAKWQGRDLDIYGAGAHLLWFPGSWAAGDENAAVDWADGADEPLLGEQLGARPRWPQQAA